MEIEGLRVRRARARDGGGALGGWEAGPGLDLNRQA